MWFSLPDLHDIIAAVSVATLGFAVMGFFAIIGLFIWGYRELKRLDIVLGALIVQEDEKLRALVENRIDDLLARLPR